MLGSHLPASGGVLDQPAGLFYGAMQARHIDYLLEQEAKPNFKINDSALSADERKELIRLQNLRKDIQARKR